MLPPCTPTIAPSCQIAIKPPATSTSRATQLGFTLPTSSLHCCHQTSTLNTQIPAPKNKKKKSFIAVVDASASPSAARATIKETSEHCQEPPLITPPSQAAVLQCRSHKPMLKIWLHKSSFSSTLSVSVVGVVHGVVQSSKKAHTHHYLKHYNKTV